MIRAFAAAALCCLALPAFANDYSITIDNRASQAVDRANTYPVDADGDAVEDNLGNTGDIAPGTKGRFAVDVDKCRLVRVYIGMANGKELDADVNLCKGNTIVVTD